MSGLSLQPRFDEALQRDLEAAHYAANRARRQYDASAPPENRLVAAELELGSGSRAGARSRGIERHRDQAPQGRLPSLETSRPGRPDPGRLRRGPGADVGLRKLIDQPWTIMCTGARDWAHGF